MRLGTLGLAVALALTFLSAPLVADAQQPVKIHRIGVLGITHAPPWEAFRQGLRDLGYVEGKNVAIEWRFNEGRVERLPPLAAELVDLKVDLIVAAASGVRAAKEATKAIPIVMVAVGDPVGIGIVASYARPGGNVTGLAFDVSQEEGGKRLELIREAAPKAARIAYVYDPRFFGMGVDLKSTQAAARALGLQLQILELRPPGSFEDAFATMARRRTGAVVVRPDPIAYLHQKRIADLAAQHRIPAIYGFRESVEAGGLMSYGASLSDMFRRAAVYVDKILKGAKPADLPVEQPMRFEVVINMKTAKALGLTFPQSIILRTDQVIQ